jgi:nucleoside-diphosphate-sugar epimerase
MLELLDRRGWDTAGIDITDGFDAVTYFRTQSARWDLVVHAAASSPHRAAIDNEPQHFALNLQLDSSLFDWAVNTGQGRVLYLSSCAAYPVRYQQASIPGPLREDDIDLSEAMEPDSVYGWTKLTGERMAAEARKAGLPVTVVRPFSGYGEDQSENFPFRALIERARRREDPFVIWGDGNQVRDWIHIDDVVEGALAVAASGVDLPVNLCTGVGWSMAELAHIACIQVGYKPRFEYLADKPAGVPYRVGNPARLHSFYQPKISLQMGIARALQDQKQPL